MISAVDIFISGVIGMIAVDILIEMLFRAQRNPRTRR